MSSFDEAKVLGQKECFICHQRYETDSDRRLIAHKTGEYVYLNSPCYEKVRALATKNRVSLAEGLNLYSEQLASALLGSSR